MARDHETAGDGEDAILESNKMNNITFGEKLRQLRKAKGLSLREVASLIRVSSSFLSDVELGRRFPSAPKLKLLAHELDVAEVELKKYDSRERDKIQVRTGRS